MAMYDNVTVMSLKKKKETKIEKKKKERNFEPRIKLSHDIYIPAINVSLLLYKSLSFK